MASQVARAVAPRSDGLDEVVGEMEMVPRIQEQTTQVHAGTIRVIGSKIVGEDVAFQ